ncbi:MAG TPA: PAS domain S-box protein [Flavisolibacter sp.]|nr:PAS domain S-box protein [Flavisolibacter sp.]
MTTNTNAPFDGGNDVATLVPIKAVPAALEQYSAFDPLAVLNSFSEAFVVVNHVYEVLYINDSTKKLFRLPAVLPKNPSVTSFLPPDRVAKACSYIDRAIAGKESRYETNFTAIHEDCWLQVVYTPVWNAAGEVASVVITAKDITERKRVEVFKQELQAYEEKLFHARALFEQFMENAPFPAWVTDEKGVMQYMNALYRTSSGFSKTDIGKSIYDLYPTQMGVDYHLNNLQVIYEGQPIEFIEKGEDENGTLRIVKIFKFPLSFDGIAMVGGWAIDITEQQKMQEELTLSIERYHYANEATSDAIYDWDIVTGKIHSGEGFFTLFGYAEKEVSIRFRLSLIHPDDLEEYKKVVFSALRGNTTNHWQLEYRLKDAQGKYRNVVDKAFIINSNKRAVRVIGALQDVTAQKELQVRLIEQERKSKRDVIRSIIETQERERRQLSVELHDNINQMLASCKLMLEVAQTNTELAPVLTKKSYEGLQTVITEIRKLSHQLNPSAIEDIGLDEAVREMVDKINISKKVQIAYNCWGQENETQLQGKDKVAIYRIIQEQLSNILKHAQATHVQVQLNLELPKVLIEIKDDGIGFHLPQVKKGLGLKSIQNRVDYYFGELDIITTPGKGCLLKAWINVEG